MANTVISKKQMVTPSLFLFIIIFLCFFTSCVLATSIAGHRVEGLKWVTFFKHTSSYLRRGKRVSGISSRREGYRRELFISGPVLVTNKSAFAMERAFLQELELNDFDYSAGSEVWFMEFSSRRECALYIQEKKAKAKRDGYIIQEFKCN